MTSKVQIYPVDHLCPIKGTIYTKDNIAYSCTLNQTDIEANKNKFYIMQIVKSASDYNLHIRYGRISENGKVISKSFNSENSAIAEFCKQFKAKTGNTFGTSGFVKKTGKYFMTAVQYEVEESVIKDETKTEKKASALDDRQKFLMELFTNKKTMENTLVSMSINPKKMPLGKISKSQLDEAGKILSQIREYLNKDKENDSDNESGNDSDDNSDSSDDLELSGGSDEESENKNIQNDLIYTSLSSEFYTLVPYSCGRNRPPIINSDELLGKFSDMIDELKNLEVAIKVTKQGGDNLDNVYNSLDAQIKPVIKDSKMWKVISDYIVNTHGSTHKFSTQLVDIYELARNGESSDVEKTLKQIGNRQLLWHGSRMTNFCSIIKNGLILNPETLGVYVSGKMFGQGVYLASAFSKSVNYCASDTSGGYACLLLCESALGTQLKKTQADGYLGPVKLKAEKCHSTWGQGQNTPSSSVKIDDMVVPNGKLKKSDVSSSCLLYDEYIVYNTNQISLKYLVIVKL